MTAEPSEGRAAPIRVYRVPLEATEERLARCGAHLDPGERERAARFATPDLRRRFAIAHGALREILAEATGRPPGALRFAHSPLGKPSLPDFPDLGFNLSHSGELALVAVAPGREVGVDVERLRPGVDFPGLARSFFSSPEREALERVPPERFLLEFLRIWTRKEAYLKCRGQGLRMPLADFAVPLGELARPQGMTWTREPGAGPGWWVQEVACPEGYCGAVCLEGGGWRVELADQA